MTTTPGTSEISITPSAASGDQPDAPLDDSTSTPVPSIELRLKSLEDTLSKILTILDKLGNKTQTRDSAPAKTSKPKSAKPKPKRSSAGTNAIFTPNNFTRFYSIQFPPKSKRKLNPFYVQSTIRTAIGAVPKCISSDSRDSFTIEVSSAEQGDKLQQITSIGTHTCTVIKHKYFNQSRGLIYIREYDLDEIDDFKQGLQDQYPFIAKVEHAFFIRPKYEGTKVFLLTFNLEFPPETLYIPGERSDTVVHRYFDRPLQCKHCQGYGHTKNRCNKSPKCRKCSEEGHSVADCESQITKCANCMNPHDAGSRECSVEQEERKVVEIQFQRKVGRRQAKQILHGPHEERNITRATTEFQTHFICRMDETDKRKLTPWLLQRCLERSLGHRPTNIRSSNKSSFLVEVDHRRSSEIMPTIKKINDIDVQISECTNFGSCKGLVYIYGYDMTDFESYRNGLIMQPPIQDAQKATWIKSRNPLSTPLLLTLNMDEPPLYLNIVGEQGKTRVYEYLPKPMVCKICIEYGHTAKYCKETSPTCRKCGIVGHSQDRCISETTICHHCRDEHPTATRKCPIFRFEEEIIKIQYKDKTTRSQAKTKLLKDNPSLQMNYARATKDKNKQTANNSTIENTSNAEQRTENDDSSTSGGSPTSGNMEVDEGEDKGDQGGLRRKREEDDAVTPDADNRKKAMVDIAPSPDQMVTEAVCVSPISGSLFTAEVIIDTPNQDDPPLDPDDLTSESNPIIRSEAKQLFNEYTLTKTSDPNNSNNSKSSSSLTRPKSTSRFQERSRNSSRHYRDRSRSPHGGTSSRSRGRSRSRSRSRPRSRDRSERHHARDRSKSCYRHNTNEHTSRGRAVKRTPPKQHNK